MPKLIKNDDKFIFNRHTRFGRPRSVVYYYYFFCFQLDLCKFRTYERITMVNNQLYNSICGI